MADQQGPQALPPPTGGNNSAELIRSLAAVASLATIVLALRIFCKTRYAKSVGVDDGVLAMGWACLIAFVCLVCVSTNYGLGTHIFEVDFTKLPKANELLFVGEFFGIIGISFAKTSFCITLLRLAVARWHKILIWVCLITVNGFMWPCAITFFVGCTPLEKKWDNSVPGTCIDTAPVVYYAVFAGIWSAMTDFILAVFPWFLVWNLKMRKVEKLGVCVCMSMGVLSGIFAIVKSAYLIPSFEDYTYKSTPLLIWSASELSIVIIASSLPFLRLFYKELRVRSSKGHGKSAYADAYNMDKMNNYSKMGTAPHTSKRTQADAAGKSEDDSSDRSILAYPKSTHHIMRTDEITIERRVAGDVDSQKGYDV